MGKYFELSRMQPDTAVNPYRITQIGDAPAAQGYRFITDIDQFHPFRFVGAGQKFDFIDFYCFSAVDHIEFDELDIIEGILISITINGSDQ